nr:MAG TPA: hypothetical protein [Caudoviricetes sp.]
MGREVIMMGLLTITGQKITGIERITLMGI